jgi:hypothetical protein
LDIETLSILTRSLNTAMVILLAVGLALRFRPKAHIPIMLIAFAVDLGNVILVEVYARQKNEGVGAVEKGLATMIEGQALLPMVHITVSILCILGYVVAAITGTLLYRRGILRTAHRWNAAIFILNRLASYVTSFWM